MKAENIKAGATIKTYNVYTGRTIERVIMAISKTAAKITVKREDWQTGEMIFNYRPTTGQYFNDYAGETFTF
jgi:hypothetical protein